MVTVAAVVAYSESTRKVQECVHVHVLDVWKIGGLLCSSQPCEIYVFDLLVRLKTPWAFEHSTHFHFKYFISSSSQSIMLPGLMSSSSSLFPLEIYICIFRSITPGLLRAVAFFKSRKNAEFLWIFWVDSAQQNGVLSSFYQPFFWHKREEIMKKYDFILL